MNPVQQNLLEIEKLIAQETVHSVRIMAVTKKQPASRIQEALEAGVHLLGVNYAQEGAEQRALFESKSIEWHFIGHIQSRKVKDLLHYHCIESIDRLEIVKALHERLEPLEKSIQVLVELNVANEPNKSGIAPENLPDFLKSMQDYSRVKPVGLMVLPPPLPDLELRRPFFKKTKETFDQLSGEYPFSMLSMGTSDDFIIAVQEGSTLIRLGTKLLGNRD